MRVKYLKNVHPIREQINVQFSYFFVGMYNVDFMTVIIKWFSLYRCLKSVGGWSNISDFIQGQTIYLEINKLWLLLFLFFVTWFFRRDNAQYQSKLHNSPNTWSFEWKTTYDIPAYVVCDISAVIGTELTLRKISFSFFVASIKSSKVFNLAKASCRSVTKVDSCLENKT